MNDTYRNIKMKTRKIINIIDIAISFLLIIHGLAFLGGAIYILIVPSILMEILPYMLILAVTTVGLIISKWQK